MKIKAIIIMFASAILFFAVTNAKAQLVDTIGVSNLSDYTSKGYVILDLDSPNDYNNGHIDGALNLNYYDTDFAKRLSSYDPNANFIIYGRNSTSDNALQIMRNAGFRNVYRLNGGYDAWKTYSSNNSNDNTSRSTIRERRKSDDADANTKTNSSRNQSK